MAPDEPIPPADPPEDPFEDRRAPLGASPESEPPAGGGEPAAPGGPWPRDYDLAWTVGWGDQPPSPGTGPPRRPPRRRRRLSAQAFAVFVSLAALALGVVAVLLSSGGPVDEVRYVQVRPPEVIGPAPQFGAPAAPDPSPSPEPPPQVQPAIPQPLVNQGGPA